MDDLIRRRDAIGCCMFGRTSLGLVGELRRLPSVEAVPVIRCKDCKYSLQNQLEIYHHMKI